MKKDMIRFSADDEEYLEHITPPISPPHTDGEYGSDEKEKDLWYKDKSAPSSALAVSVRYLHNNNGRHSVMAGETIEVNVVCTVKQLQLLSGFLEGFSVVDGQCEETLCMQEVMLYPHQQHQEAPESEPEAPLINRHSLRDSVNKHFKFWLTVPQTATPSLRISDKTGIFYRVRVGGIGEVHHYTVIAAQNRYPQTLPSHDSHVIGGVDNYVPIKVRNNTCKFVQNRVLESVPATSCTKSLQIQDKGDISLKAHLFGSSPCAILGQICNMFVTIENNTDKPSRGITVKLVQSLNACSTSKAFQGTCADEDKPHKKTITKYRFYGEEYSCEPHTKKQTEVSITLPFSISPTIVTQHIQAWYTLLIRIDGHTSSLEGEIQLLVLPCTHELCFRP